MKYSPSRHKTLKRCDRYYYLHYIEGWRETSEKPWLTYGKAIDELLSIYDLKGIDACLMSVGYYFVDEFEIINITYLLKHYHKKLGKKILAPLTVEGQPGNQWYGKAKLKPDYTESDIQVEGYLDKVSEDNGYPCVVERKTTADPIEYTSAYWKPLLQDKQIISYTYLLSDVTGCPVNRVYYEVLRKCTPQGKGMTAFKKSYTKNKKNVYYSIKEYEENVKNFFETTKITMVARRKLWVTDDMRSEWMADLIADDDHLANMMENARSYKANDMNPILAYPRNQHGCEMYGGCQFIKFCNGESELCDMDNIFKKEK